MLSVFRVAVAAPESAPQRQRISQPATAPNEQNPLHRVLDYARSFVTFVFGHEFNFARLQIDSRTVLLDRRGEVEEIFYRFVSCKSEDTHGKGDLFQSPNYDFSGVLSTKSYVLFRSPPPPGMPYDERGPIKKRFDRFEWNVRYEPAARELTSNQQIVTATRAAQLLVGRTELVDDASGRKAVIEYPIKTQNVNLKKQIYQVDTGPLAFPDFRAKSERPIDLVQLAFVAHNRADSAHFVVQRRTQVCKADKPALDVYHYGETLRLPARNTMWAVD